jgi:hypothetical protein
MRSTPSREDHFAKQLMRRLDRVAGEINVFLVVIALGLAVLDFTCLWAFTIEDALPPITRIGDNSTAPLSGSTGLGAPPAQQAPQH